MRLGKTALAYFASQILVSVTGFAATWFIAQELGAAGLGTYQVVVMLGFFWLAIPANAVGTGVRKRMSEGEAPAEFFGVGVLLNGLMGLGLAAFVYGVGHLVGEAVPNPTREIVVVLTTYNAELAVLTAATYVFRTVTSSLQGQKRVAATGNLLAAERVLRTTLQVAALLAGYGVAALALGHAAALVAAAVVGLVLLATVKPTTPSREQVRDVAEFARYAWMGAFRSRVFGWMDRLVLALFVPAALIGIYGAAWGLGSLLATASASIQQTLFPEVSDLSSDEDYERVIHHLEEALVFAGAFVLPGLAGSAVIGRRVLRIYSPEFGQGWGILLVLITAYLADVYASQFVSVINAIDHPDRAYHINVRFVAANLALNFALVPAIGWYGAAIATAASSALRAVLGYRALDDILGRVEVPARAIGQEAGAAVVMAAVIWPLRTAVPGGWPGTLLLVAIGAATYMVVLLAISPRVREKVASLIPASVPFPGA